MKTFLSHIPHHYKPVPYKFHRGGYKLFFDMIEGRYHVYRMNDQPIMNGYWVHIFSRQFVSTEIGRELKRGDLTLGGTKGIEQVEKDFLKDIFEMSDQEKNWIKNQVRMYEEWQREYDKFMHRGLMHHILGRKGKSSAKTPTIKRRYFVNMKTGERRKTMPDEWKKVVNAV